MTVAPSPKSNQLAADVANHPAPTQAAWLYMLYRSTRQNTETAAGTSQCALHNTVAQSMCPGLLTQRKNHVSATSMCLSAMLVVTCLSSLQPTDTRRGKQSNTSSGS
jgi:hypothetical protein